MDRIIQKLEGQRPRLLLHACCAACASSVLEELTRHFELTILWYNPNIYPQQEYERRYEALVKLLKDMDLAGEVEIVALPWRSQDYSCRVSGLEKEPEGGSRCTECFRLRLEETARMAKELGFNWFCSTLSVSRHKDAVRINTLGEEQAARFGVPWLPSDFKKRDGENRAVELCEKYNVYRQLYCGCEFSYIRRQQGKDQIIKE